jgi:hypothetical protein
MTKLRHNSTTDWIYLDVHPPDINSLKRTHYPFPGGNFIYLSFFYTQILESNFKNYDTQTNKEKINLYCQEVKQSTKADIQTSGTLYQTF